MRTVKPVALAAALMVSTAAAQAQTCSFFDVGSGQTIEGKCSVEYRGDAEVIQIGTKRIEFVTAARQGQWAVGTLDGKPAMRYELNRTAYSYATRDLTLFLDLSQ
jgi:hypothetical protein